MTDIGLYSLDKDNAVVFSFKNISRLVYGPEEALQVVAYHVFSTPASNSYNRNEGGGMRSVIKGPVRSRQEVNADAVIIVNRAQKSILSAQSQDKPANATITSLKLQRATAIRDKLEIQIDILINLLDGNSFQATFRVT